MMLTAPTDTTAARETDTTLVSAVLAGDGLAFQRIMRSNNRRLFRVARSIVRNDADAEDVVQDSYISAYGALSNFNGDSSLSTWLTRIVVNAALQRLRRQHASSRTILPQAETQHGDAAPADHETLQETPESLALRAELRRLLELSVDCLPESYRAVFILRLVEGLSIDETAACLGISRALVKTRLLRARRLLRESLGDKIGPLLEDVFAFDGARCDRLVSNVCARLGFEYHPLRQPGTSIPDRTDT